MDYFCKPNGVGNGTTIESAGEFTDLIVKLRAGDTLHVLNGIYNYDKQITLNLFGDEEKKIKIVAEDEGNRPVFDFRYQPYGSKYDSDCNGMRIFGDYAIIDGIVLCYAGFKGIRSELNNSVLNNIEVYGCVDSGIQMASGGNNALFNCVSHDNFGYKRMDGDEIKFGYDSDGISDKLHYGLPNNFVNCVSYDNTDDGFDFFGRCTEEFTTLVGCKSFRNGVREIDMRNHARYEVDRDWFEQFKGDGKIMPTAFGNDYSLVTLEKYPAFGNGNGFKLGGNMRYHCVDLYECEADYNKMKGFDQNNNSGIMKLHYCSAEGNIMFDYGFRNKRIGDVYLEDCISKTNTVAIESKNNKSVNCSWNEFSS